MKKYLVLFLTLIVLSVFSGVYAKMPKSVKSDFENVINNSGVDIESISISIKNADNNKVVYSLNDKMLMNPASVQKILTTPVVAEVLGEDYTFTTSIYSRGEDYILKLGADPYLTTTDLKKLLKNVSKEANKLSIDDRILDSKTWGEGWQWDDDMNILMPRFGSYNLDKNLIKITILPAEDGQFATIMNPSKYPLVFFNHIIKGDKTELDIRRDNAISANTLMLSGTVARPTAVYIPTNNLQGYFNVQLKRALEDRSIYLKTVPTVEKVNSDDILRAEVTHSLDAAINDILKNSNNLVSETVFKLAGARYLGLETGSDSAGIKMFNDYCVKNNLDNSRIRITDASGVSKNNLVSTDFVTDFLVLNKNNKLMDRLAKPGEGTLTHRMLPIKDFLRAKTGTLSDTSSIAGYLRTRNGKNLTFCIIMNDMKLSTSDKKMLEDYILREAYLKL